MRLFRLAFPLASALCLAACLATGSPAPAADDDPASGPSRRPIRTFIETRSLAHERLLPYLEAARPQVVQIGNYGAMFHGYADNPRSTGWPMNLPVSGERAALEFQRRLNGQVHDLGLKVVGHFRLVKVVGNWEEQTGFVEYYNDRWPRDLLGPKPHPRVEELLARGAAGKPIQLSRSSQAQLALCLSSPYTRQMLKQMLKVAIDQGVDGVISNFNYRYDCTCPHCQSAFKEWLRERHTPEEIRAKLDIENLDEHRFYSIPARIPGYPDTDAATEMDWLAVRWGAEHFKRMFDEIFIDYGRSIKKDLLVAQWNHLGHVGITEERAFLPIEMWGRGEDYFWYSGGAAFVDRNLNLSEGKAGDAWLSCLYVREMTGRKPFVIGKYDRVRMAASMAEGYATGGMGMGRYMRFEEPAGYEVLARYTSFIHEHRHLYDEAIPWSDAALVLPRQSILNRRPQALDVFRDLGQALVERQVLLDVVLDQTLTAERLAQYPTVILTDTQTLSADQARMLENYMDAGGLLIVCDPTRTTETVPKPSSNDRLRKALKTPADDIESAADAIGDRIQRIGGAMIDAPWTVRATAYRQPGRILLHLVNYDREDGAPENNRTGPETERPRAAENISVQLRLPANRPAESVTLHAPDRAESLRLSFEQDKDQVRFTVPRLHVYGVIAVGVGNQE
jgi:hypothetical protein